MLEALTAQPQDKILQLIALYRDDQRADKIDLGVGVYKDATGLTPVMRAVKAAEQKLWQVEQTKTYTTLAGDPAFGTAMTTMILGDGYADRAAAIATPGGTGAIRQALELVKLAAPQATVWLSNPTWPNHPSILNYLGMKSAEYRYFDAKTCGIDFTGLLEDLAQVQPGLSGLWRRAGTGRRCHKAGGRILSRGADRGVLQQEFRHLPRTHRHPDRPWRPRAQGRDAGQPELSEPTELQLSPRSRRKAGDDDPGRPGLDSRLEGRTGGGPA